MDLKVPDFINLGIGGLLSILWFDIRSIRKTTKDQHKECDDKYIAKDEHILLCENSTLRLEKKIDAVKGEIIEEIRRNGQK